MTTLTMYRLNKAVFKPKGGSGFLVRTREFVSQPENGLGERVESMTRGFHYRVVLTASSRHQRAALEAYVLRAAVMHYFKVHEVKRSVAYDPDGDILFTCEVVLGAYIRPDFGPGMYAYDRNTKDGALRFVSLLDDALGDIPASVRDDFYALPCVLSVDSVDVGSVVDHLRSTGSASRFIPVAS